MKLAVNKKHKRGDFEKKKSSTYIKLVSLAVAASTFSGLLSTVAINLKNVEEIVSLNANVRSSVYFNNDYLKDTYGLNDDEIFERVNDGSNVDKYITKEALKNITMLNIDRQKNDDLSFLKNFPNLTELSVLNASLLTQEDITYINNSNLKMLTIQLSVDDIIKLNSSGIDINSLTSKHIELNIKGEVKNELHELIIYNFIKDNLNIKCEDIDILKCVDINMRLEQIYNKIDFSDCVNESDKVFRIINFLLNYIEYDESLDAYQQTHSTFDENSEEYAEFYCYNKQMLSSVLIPGQNNVEGICCNFSALFSILCFKEGIENYYVIGEYNNGSVLHSWNVLKVDGEQKLVDLVRQDVFYYKYKEYQDYQEEPNTLNLIDLKNKLIESIDQDILNDYVARVNVDELFANLEENDYKIYNVSLDGELVNNQELDFGLPIIISVGTGMIIVLLNKGRKRNEGLTR